MVKNAGNIAPVLGASGCRGGRRRAWRVNTKYSLVRRPADGHHRVYRR